MRSTNSDGRIQNVLSMIKGKTKWLKNNTGTTYDPTTDHFIMNEEGILNNNRHWTNNRTRMQGIYDGTATTEGQTILILGYLHAYMATGDKQYLADAERYTEAHLRYFYDNKPIPETPSRWTCNWVINGKEPVLANYPINPDVGTQGGFKCVPVMITNGKGQVPHGHPFWGEYMDVMMYAHRGAMSWESINARTQRIQQDIDGLINWDEVLNHVITDTATPWESTAWVDWEGLIGEKPTINWESGNRAKQYKISTVNVHTGWKIGVGKGPADQSWSGEELEEVPHSEIGEFQLEDNTVNGVYFVNYATQNPLDKGGYLVGRNEAWHNRPIMTPFINHRETQMGDAADAQVWLIDCLYILWRLTGKDKYKKALESNFYTSHEYTYMDIDARFFRKGVGLATPFTDGTSYSYTSGEAVQEEISRDEGGYISVYVNTGRVYLEQKSVRYRVSLDSTLKVEIKGYTLHGESDVIPTATVNLTISPEKNSPEGAISYSLPLNLSEGPVHYIPFSRMIQSTPPEGKHYVTVDNRAIVDVGDTEYELSINDSILGKLRDTTAKVSLNGPSSQFIYGFWLEDGSVLKVDRVTYKSEAPLALHIKDDEGWAWHWPLPVSEDWVTLDTPLSGLVLNSWQPNGGERPTKFAGSGHTDQVSFRVVDEENLPAKFEFYCFNDLPDAFNEIDGWTRYFTLVVGNAKVPCTFQIGDCLVENYRLDSVRYTPGVIPFSNAYINGSSQIGDWRGLPYPGYQWPMMYCIQKNHNWFDVWLNNQIDFMYDAQVAYTDKWGEVGPEAAAFVWDREDALSYGPADTWIFYHWDKQTPWSGYHPRSYMSASRAWYELSIRGRNIPEKLQLYVERWTSWLAKYIKRWGNLPTSFPTNENAMEVPPNPINSHQTGLWLAGSCYGMLAGMSPEHGDIVADACVSELVEHRDIIPSDKPGFVMSGAWSPWADPNGTNGMAYGFHTGELLRGMGLYIMYRNHGSGYNIFDMGELTTDQASLDFIDIK